MIVETVQRFINVLTVVLLLTACGGRGKTTSVTASGDTIRLQYAENLTLVDCEDYVVATLRNPWDTAQVLHTYILIDRVSSSMFSFLGAF